MEDNRIKKKNEDILELHKKADAVEMVKSRRLERMGHVLRDEGK